MWRVPNGDAPRLKEKLVLLAQGIDGTAKISELKMAIEGLDQTPVAVEDESRSLFDFGKCAEQISEISPYPGVLPHTGIDSDRNVCHCRRISFNLWKTRSTEIPSMQ
jgi:hypothetical protein